MLQSRTALWTLCLAAAATLGLVAVPSLAGESSHAAASVCSGRGLRNVDGALVNTDRRRTRTATCFLQTFDLSNGGGAYLYWVATRGNKGTIVCTGSSYNQSNTLLESVVGPTITSADPGVQQRLIELTTSDGSGDWSGYYKLSCVLPAKSRLHTVGLEEDPAP